MGNHLLLVSIGKISAAGDEPKLCWTHALLIEMIGARLRHGAYAFV